jgi:hypothetical protein
VASWQGWDRKAPSRARVGDAKFVRLDKVSLCSHNKECYNAEVFSQGQLKLTCAPLLHGFVHLPSLDIPRLRHFCSRQD